MTKEESQTMTDALNQIADALSRLGNGDASTDMGGLEALGLCVKEGSQVIADSINNLADAIRESKQ